MRILEVQLAGIFLSRTLFYSLRCRESETMAILACHQPEEKQRLSDESLLSVRITVAEPILNAAEHWKHHLAVVRWKVIFGR